MITVSDGVAPPVSQTFQIVVANVNDPPLITSLLQATVDEDSLTATHDRMDPDRDPLTIAAPTLPPWLRFTPPATIAGTPDAIRLGVHNVSMTVSDGLAPPVAQAFQVTVRSVDDAPVIAPIPDQTATENMLLSLNLAQFVTDADTPHARLRFTTTEPVASRPLAQRRGPAGRNAAARGCRRFHDRAHRQRRARGTSGKFISPCSAQGEPTSTSPYGGTDPVAVNTPATWTLTTTNNSQSRSPAFRSRPRSWAKCRSPLAAPSTPACSFAPSGNGRSSLQPGPAAGWREHGGHAERHRQHCGRRVRHGHVAVSGPTPIDETTRNDTASGSLSIAQSVSAQPAQVITVRWACGRRRGFERRWFRRSRDRDGRHDGTVVLLNIVDPQREQTRARRAARARRRRRQRRRARRSRSGQGSRRRRRDWPRRRQSDYSVNGGNANFTVRLSTIRLPTAEASRSLTSTATCCPISHSRTRGQSAFT